MLTGLGDLWGKKRFWLPLLGTVIMVGAAGSMSALGLPDELITTAVQYIGGLFGAGTLANAAADFGKEKAKLEKE